MNKEHWKRENLSIGDTEEFQYSEAIDNIINKLGIIKNTMNKYDMEIYSAITNSEEKVKKMYELEMISDILDMVDTETKKLL
jgi:hypothetical protein